MFRAATTLPERAAAETGLSQAVAHMEAHYGLSLSRYLNLPYPYNVLMTQRELRHRLNTGYRHRDISIVQEEQQQLSISVSETFDRDYGLYFIPVLCVYQLWQEPRNNRTAELLTAVLAYLYIEAGICYYRDEGTSMYYNYAALEEWVEEAADEDEEAYHQRKHSLKQAETAGDFLQEKMMATGFLQSLPELIAAFMPANAYERQALAIAETALRLMEQNPQRNLYQHASEVPQDDDDYDGYSHIHIAEYVSFIASFDDAMGEDLMSMVNNEFNERLYFQEPQLTTLFSEPQQPYTDALAYEAAVFALICDLCTLLNEKP